MGRSELGRKRVGWRRSRQRLKLVMSMVTSHGALSVHGRANERCWQYRQPVCEKPELLATGPNRL